MYEDLLTPGGLDNTLRGLVRHLGVEPNFTAAPKARTMVQADALTEDWVNRYLTDSKN